MLDFVNVYENVFDSDNVLDCMNVSVGGTNCADIFVIKNSIIFKIGII